MQNPKALVMRRQGHVCVEMGTQGLTATRLCARTIAMVAAYATPSQAPANAKSLMPGLVVQLGSVRTHALGPIMVNASRTESASAQLSMRAKTAVKRSA